jgi:hypothetical protein
MVEIPGAPGPSSGKNIKIKLPDEHQAASNYFFKEIYFTSQPIIST